MGATDAQRPVRPRGGLRPSPDEDRVDVTSETPAFAASGDPENPLASSQPPPPSGSRGSTPRSSVSGSHASAANSGSAQLLWFFGRSSRRGGGGAAAAASPHSDDHNDHEQLHETEEDARARLLAEKHRMERVYREVSGQTRRGRALTRQGTSGGEDGDANGDDIGAWGDMEGNVAARAPSVASTLRFTRRTKKKKKTKTRLPLPNGPDAKGGAGGTETPKDGDVSTEYLDAVLVKPTNEVFNPYTRFFLDRNLERLYQEYTAVNWFAWARVHMLMWMGVHGLVALMYWIVPFSGFERMDLFLMDDTTVTMWLQYAYLVVALPFALLPSKVNPFQKHWRAWVCLLIILFNLTFQMWLASANRAAVDVVVSDVDKQYVCAPPNATESDNGGNANATTRPPPTAQELHALADLQKNSALSIVQLYSDALVQVVAVFASAFSFILIVSTRVEFVQCVIVGVSAVVTYVLVVVGYGMAFEWMTAVAYLFALILLLVLSRSSDLNNRRSFLSQLVVERENESLQSYLTQAEAVLMNDAACDEEKLVVGNVLDNPEMKHLDMVRIPFSDIKLLQAIGRGAMGDVIKAKYFGTIVVCKRMRRENITEAAITSFREEIELMSSLRHPNIVQFIGATWDNCSNVCIVMEYLENGDMHSVLHSNMGRNFTWADPLLKMAIDAAQGMLYLHAQETPIVHRDLKSVNIFCSATFGCKVGDFGLSKKHDRGIDALTTLVGTPFWLAPELIRNERYGPKADVFSFGIVLTELETRRTPYHDQEETGLKVLMRIAKGLRPSLPSTCLPVRRQLIVDCLHDEPAKRPTFAEILRRLQGAVQQEIEESVLRAMPAAGSAAASASASVSASAGSSAAAIGGGGAAGRVTNMPPHPHALGKRGSDPGLRGGEQQQQQPGQAAQQQPKRDYFYDMINNVNNV